MSRTQSLQERFVTSHDSGDVPDTNDVQRTLQGHVDGIGPMKLYVSRDTSYPGQGYAYLALWTQEKGFERFATLHGHELVRKRDRVWYDGIPTGEIVARLFVIAERMLGGIQP